MSQTAGRGPNGDPQEHTAQVPRRANPTRATKGGGKGWWNGKQHQQGNNVQTHCHAEHERVSYLRYLKAWGENRAIQGDLSADPK